MITLKEDFMVKALFSSKEIILKQFISDVLSIPMEEIRSVRIANPYLRKKYYRHKQGILDILLFLNEDRKINIELQVKIQKEWRKRNLFYLAEMDMILSKTKNEGIMEAVQEMKILNLRKRIRYEYKMWLKAKRDRWAEDDYIRDEGIAIGKDAQKTSVVKNMLAHNMSIMQICKIAECDEAYVEKIKEGLDHKES